MKPTAPGALRRVRARWTHWWVSRPPRTDRLTLTHRNLYILPSQAGWSLAVVTLVLLLASVNEQINLGYALAFALTGAALAGLHQTHGNLQGLTLTLHPPPSTHAGGALTLTVTLDGGARRRGRHGLRLQAQDARGDAAALEVEVAPGAAQWIELDVPAPARGRHPLPRIGIESRYPLGLFRVWAWWRPACTVLVWPALDGHAPPVQSQLTAGAADNGGPARDVDQQATPEGLRAYQRGDPMHWIAWKKSSGGDTLVSRERLPERSHTLWLDYARSPGLAGLAHEARLCRLAAWLHEAEALEGQALQYGLQLPDRRVEAGRSAAHLRHCLDALAECEGPA